MARQKSSLTSLGWSTMPLESPASYRAKLAQVQRHIQDNQSGMDVVSLVTWKSCIPELNRLIAEAEAFGVKDYVPIKTVNANVPISIRNANA